MLICFAMLFFTIKINLSWFITFLLVQKIYIYEYTDTETTTTTEFWNNTGVLNKYLLQFPQLAINIHIQI